MSTVHMRNAWASMKILVYLVQPEMVDLRIDGQYMRRDGRGRRLKLGGAHWQTSNELCSWKTPIRPPPNFMSFGNARIKFTQPEMVAAA